MFLLFSLENLSIGVCGDDNLNETSTASSRNGKRQSLIPLRETTDYEQSEKDEDYYDEYEPSDGDQYPDAAEGNDVQHKIVLKANNDDEDSSDEHPIRVEITQTVASPVVVSSTSSTDGTVAIELCPKECSCLSDFMDCIRMNLDRLPHVPPWVSSL